MRPSSATPRENRKSSAASPTAGRTSSVARPSGIWPTCRRAPSGGVATYYRGTRIKAHPPQAPGAQSTDYTDYPSERTPYAMRAPDACIRQAEALGPALGPFTAVLLSGTCPWARLRQAQKLLRLAERYGAARVNTACARALAFELLDVRRVERIVRTALERAPGRAEPAEVRPL